jgi:signal peptidase I
MVNYQVDMVPHVFLEPGDIVIFSDDANEGRHAVMVGARHNTVWHSTPEKGVHEDHIQDVYDEFSSSTICRPKDKDSWMI